MPLGLLTIVILLGCILKSKRLKKIARFTALGMAILFTNPFLANLAMKSWEYDTTDISGMREYETAIVLTGVADNTREPRDRVYFHAGADRVLHAVKLYKEKKIKNIIISGGSGAFIKPEYSEAETLKKAFLDLGVSEGNLFLESTSQNTRQSAANVRKQYPELLQRRPLIITSSFHLKRSILSFRMAGIECDGFPVDFKSGPIRYTPDAWIPNPDAMVKWTTIFREILGIAAYSIVGID